MVNVPDNLAMIRATQRIKELEQSLRDEAGFLPAYWQKNPGKTDKPPCSKLPMTAPHYPP